MYVQDLVCTKLPGTEICKTMATANMAIGLIVLGSIIGLLFGMYQYDFIKGIKLPKNDQESYELRALANSGEEHKVLSSLTPVLLLF